MMYICITHGYPQMLILVRDFRANSEMATTHFDESTGRNILVFGTEDQMNKLNVDLYN